MQHHELKKYLEFTVNKKPDKWKIIKIFAHEPTGIKKKKLLLKKDAKLVINGKTRTRFTFLELFDFKKYNIFFYSNTELKRNLRSNLFIFIILNEKNFFFYLKKIFLCTTLRMYYATVYTVGTRLSGQPRIEWVSFIGTR